MHTAKVLLTDSSLKYTSRRTPHLAGAALDHQKSVLAHSPCLLGVCERGARISALEMHIVLLLSHVGTVVNGALHSFRERIDARVWRAAKASHGSQHVEAGFPHLLRQRALLEGGWKAGS